MPIPRPNKIDTVIYHADCVDGVGAAYVAWRYLGMNANYLPYHHGDTPPQVVGKNVLIVDFSFSRDDIVKMNCDATSLVILDHHVSAERNLANLPYAVFDVERSGAMMAWDFFYENSPAPLLIQYIQDRDLWKWALYESREFSAGLNTVPFDFNSYSGLENEGAIASLIEKGRGILEHVHEEVLRASARCVRKQFLGYDVAIINSCNYESEIGSYLSKECDFALIWHYVNLTQIKVSLRSQEDSVDVSEIASRFGGGGHRCAAGFKVSGKSFLGMILD